MFKLSHRSTTEIVVLMFSSLTCVTVFLLITGALVGKIIHPEMDIRYLAESVNQWVSTILGALIGFVSGKAYGKWEAQNGDAKH